mmetsp:Transcript_80338/g.245569  ORF Transcript_80338/g.245569 Transcript_80338/m.245569 type:complete len:270 (-) Transcript_80338:515-1324(-)
MSACLVANATVHRTSVVTKTVPETGEDELPICSERMAPRGTMSKAMTKMATIIPTEKALKPSAANNQIAKTARPAATHAARTLRQSKLISNKSLSALPSAAPGARDRRTPMNFSKLYTTPTVIAPPPTHRIELEGKSAARALCGSTRARRKSPMRRTNAPAKVSNATGNVSRPPMPKYSGPLSSGTSMAKVRSPKAVDQTMMSLTTKPIRAATRMTKLLTVLRTREITKRGRSPACEMAALIMDMQARASGAGNVGSERNFRVARPTKP